MSQQYEAVPLRDECVRSIMSWTGNDQNIEGGVDSDSDSDDGGGDKGVAVAELREEVSTLASCFVEPHAPTLRAERDPGRTSDPRPLPHCASLAAVPCSHPHPSSSPRPGPLLSCRTTEMREQPLWRSRTRYGGTRTHHPHAPCPLLLSPYPTSAPTLPSSPANGQPRCGGGRYGGAE